MRQCWSVLCLSGLILTGAPLRSNEEAGPAAVIDKAIKATGGAAKLAKFKAVELKGKGTFYGLGKGLPYTGTWAINPPTQLRFSIMSNLDGKEFTLTQVLNGNKGWKQIFNMNPQDMRKDEIEEAREQLYSDWVMRLVPVKGKGFKLSPLGNAKVGDREAVGVRISHEGHRDVSLFFDAKSGLLVKSQTRVKDVEAGGKEQTQDILFESYKAVDGVQHPTRATIHRDGKLYVEVEYTDIQPREQLPEATFNRP